MSVSFPPPLPKPRSKFDPDPPERVHIGKLRPFIDVWSKH